MDDPWSLYKFRYSKSCRMTPTKISCSKLMILITSHNLYNNIKGKMPTKNKDNSLKWVHNLHTWPPSSRYLHPSLMTTTQSTWAKSSKNSLSTNSSNISQMLKHVGRWKETFVPYSTVCTTSSLKLKLILKRSCKRISKILLSISTNTSRLKTLRMLKIWRQWLSSPRLDSATFSLTCISTWRKSSLQCSKSSPEMHVLPTC